MACPKEGPKEKKARAREVLKALKAAYPGARTELRHENPFQLLVATVLSAQATDKSVNEATPALFARFPDAKALAEATPEEVEPYIRRIGLYRTKAKNLVALARRLVEEYGGEVPKEKEALMRLPGKGPLGPGGSGRPCGRPSGGSGQEAPGPARTGAYRAFPRGPWRRGPPGGSAPGGPRPPP